MEIPNQDKQNQIDSEAILKNLSNISKEEIEKSAELKVKEITEESIKIVKQYLESKKIKDLTDLTDPEIVLIREVSLFSIREIEKGLPSELSQIPNEQFAFMKNILDFWKTVVEKIKIWTPQINNQ